MNYRSLGHTGLRVSEISLGSWTTYGGSVGDSDTSRIIHAAFERGVNLFDTADVYVRGAAERALGAALSDLPREQVVVATKCMGRVWDGPLGAGLSRKHIFDAIDASLKRLRVDYVDLYQMHAPDPNTPIEESVRAYEDLLRSGRVRHIGFSNFDKDPPLLRRAVAYQKARGWDPFISSQPRYNLMEPRIESEHMPFCKRNGIGIIVYSPLMQGVLTNKYAGMKIPEGSRGSGDFKHFLQAEKALTPENVSAAERLAAWVERKGIGTPAQVALAWVLRRPEVSSAIIGATSVEQLDENLKSADIKLSATEWREVERATRSSGTGAKSTAAKRPARAAAAKPKRSRPSASRPALKRAASR
jgi:aryl-alcohol dehydrogenase-like predicted oxidoreductase